MEMLLAKEKIRKIAALIGKKTIRIEAKILMITSHQEILRIPKSKANKRRMKTQKKVEMIQKSKNRLQVDLF